MLPQVEPPKNVLILRDLQASLQVAKLESQDNCNCTREYFCVYCRRYTKIKEQYSEALAAAKKRAIQTNRTLWGRD